MIRAKLLYNIHSGTGFKPIKTKKKVNKKFI